MKIVKFEELPGSDLIVDALYEGRATARGVSDPISKLLPCGVQGGFRIKGRNEAKEFVVLYTQGNHRDWPDSIDLTTGRFTYYGDNRSPGKEIHDTKPKGNLLLQNVFRWLHSTPPRREMIPPFFVFSKYQAPKGWLVQFRGLAVPGFPGLSATEDLVAIWKTTNNERFQNYRSTFTILDTGAIKHDWINDLTTGNPLSANAPKAWVDWMRSGIYSPLASQPTTEIRSAEDQTPRDGLEAKIVDAIYQHFKESPTLFEEFAARVFQLTDPRVIVDEITRASVDGGRDAIGRYRLGLESDPIYAEYALEAKCYRPASNGASANSVGVKELSRLISRLRHRQFGVIVTTSFVAKQAYSEIREDRHPIIVISGRDIAEILIKNNFNTLDLVQNMLRTEFPVPLV